jgi:hypothetical protein
MKSNKIKKLLKSEETGNFNYKSYIKKLLVINFVPCFFIAVINLLIINTIIGALIANFVAPIVLPLYLLIVNTKVAFLHKRKFFLLNVLFILISLLFLFLIDYLAWGIHSKRLLHPDAETIYIVFLEVQIATIIFVLGSLIASIMLFLRSKHKVA